MYYLQDEVATLHIQCDFWQEGLSLDSNRLALVAIEGLPALISPLRSPTVGHCRDAYARIRPGLMTNCRRRIDSWIRALCNNGWLNPWPGFCNFASRMSCD